MRRAVELAVAAAIKSKPIPPARGGVARGRLRRFGDLGAGESFVPGACEKTVALVGAPRLGVSSRGDALPSTSLLELRVRIQPSCPEAQCGASAGGDSEAP